MQSFGDRVNTDRWRTIGRTILFGQYWQPLPPNLSSHRHFVWIQWTGNSILSLLLLTHSKLVEIRRAAFTGFFYCFKMVWSGSGMVSKWFRNGSESILETGSFTAVLWRKRSQSHRVESLATLLRRIGA